MKKKTVTDKCNQTEKEVNILFNEKCVLRAEKHSHCLRCGRKLKDPIAMLRGYGEKCFKQVQEKTRFSRKLFDL